MLLAISVSVPISLRFQFAIFKTWREEICGEHFLKKNFPQSSWESSAQLCSSVLRMPPVPIHGPNFALTAWFRASLQSLAAAGF